MLSLNTLGVSCSNASYSAWVYGVPSINAFISTILSYTAFLLGAVVVSASQEAQKAASLILDAVSVQVQVVYQLGFVLLYGVYHSADIICEQVLIVPVQVVYPHQLVN